MTRQQCFDVLIVLGKHLTILTRNKLCRTCLLAKKDGYSPNVHDCRLNHSMSSKSMEPESFPTSIS